MFTRLINALYDAIHHRIEVRLRQQREQDNETALQYLKMDLFGGVKS